MQRPSGSDALRSEMEEFEAKANEQMKKFQRMLAASQARENLVNPLGGMGELKGSLPPPPPPPGGELVVDPNLRNLPAQGEPNPVALTVSGRTIRDPARIRIALDYARLSREIPPSVFYNSIRSLERDLADIRRRRQASDRREHHDRDPDRSRDRDRSSPYRQHPRSHRRPRSPARGSRSREPDSRHSHQRFRYDERARPTEARVRSRSPRAVAVSELDQERERFNRSDAERRQLSADVIRIRGDRERLRIELNALKTYVLDKGLPLPSVSLPPKSVFQLGTLAPESPRDESLSGSSVASRTGDLGMTKTNLILFLRFG